MKTTTKKTTTFNYSDCYHQTIEKCTTAKLANLKLHSELKTRTTDIPESLFEIASATCLDTHKQFANNAAIKCHHCPVLLNSIANNKKIDCNDKKIAKMQFIDMLFITTAYIRKINFASRTTLTKTELKSIIYKNCALRKIAISDYVTYFKMLTANPSLLKSEKIDTDIDSIIELHKCNVEKHNSYAINITINMLAVHATEFELLIDSTVK